MRNPASCCTSLIQEVAAHPDITILTQAEVTAVSGYVGNFNVQVTQHARGVSDDMAEALMAACAQEMPDEFNYGLTQRKVIYRPYPGCYPSHPGRGLGALRRQTDPA